MSSRTPRKHFASDAEAKSSEDVCSDNPILNEILAKRKARLDAKENRQTSSGIMTVSPVIHTLAAAGVLSTPVQWTWLRQWVAQTLLRIVIFWCICICYMSLNVWRNGARDLGVGPEIHWLDHLEIVVNYWYKIDNVVRFFSFMMVWMGYAVLAVLVWFVGLGFTARFSIFVARQFGENKEALLNAWWRCDNEELRILGANLLVEGEHCSLKRMRLALETSEKQHDMVEDAVYQAAVELHNLKNEIRSLKQQLPEAGSQYIPQANWKKAVEWQMFTDNILPIVGNCSKCCSEIASKGIKQPRA